MEKVTLAFTVKWIWAWAIMHGYKTAEYRAAPPVVRKGRCAVQMSRTYDRADFDEDLKCVRSEWGADGAKVVKELPPYEKLAAYAGKVIGTVDYDATEGDGCVWGLSNPRWLRRFLSVRGHLGMWELSSADAAEINRQLAEGDPQFANCGRWRGDGSTARRVG